ncbi:alpha/beta fold hydrolase [Halalkalibacter nanhaiisediminis]|uniref:Haloacetate dehalogenase n=1 Tax=Halalkalibacter nanhaiisediminis TaxID=688079 RepID=A0A562QQX0_9BACI|nr:alpha/beta hydrolase [Halalkalibacter nanhaiisediminis]TWI59073.1 haloacetate dehalogenase [Halalkalibacter nanhaiisediminis]
MLGNFKHTTIQVEDVKINVKIAGNGKPVLFLHGYPQTHKMWHKVAPKLSETYTVVLTDLRGYGDSSCPIGAVDHSTYSKREMAFDQVHVMRELGFDSFDVVGHDRGARVAHRMALDYPEQVKSCTLLDIAPTHAMYNMTNMEFAKKYYHWFFLIQPSPMPEKLIHAEPNVFFKHIFQSWCKTPGAISEPLMEEYIRYFSRTDIIHSSSKIGNSSPTSIVCNDKWGRNCRQIRYGTLKS